MKLSPPLFALVLSLTAACAVRLHAAETLPNGIVLPDAWPPQPQELTRAPLAEPPYLKQPPKVIPIDVGRQLFVDDFLIADTMLARTFHRPEYHPASPLISPDRPWEGNGASARAAMFSDGVWFDPADKLFKLWYWAGAQVGRRGITCLATSRDGIHWDKPDLGVEQGTNIVLRDEEGYARNSSTVWLDPADPDPARRFKMFRVAKREKQNHRIRVSFSPDGVHWKFAVETDECGDRSTVFFNPFRGMWVYGLREGGANVSRCRGYDENRDPIAGARWAAMRTKDSKRWWIGADELDPSREDLDLRRTPERKFDLVPSQLYNLDCVAYESVMLGEFCIWRGQPLTRPKINEVTLGYSRDGFHWTRPDRRAFCGVSEKKEDWNWGNVQSAGGCCLIVGDKLHFYVGGVSGRTEPWHPDPMVVGLAVLRRDGFASLDADGKGGAITTRPVTFTGRHLFVNLDAPKGKLAVEILDEAGKIIAPFTRTDCRTLSGDSTKLEVKWDSAEDLSALAGKPVRFRFHLTNGSLYAFWVSKDARGASNGFLAAGGPGFTGPRDE